MTSFARRGLAKLFAKLVVIKHPLLDFFLP